MGSVLLDLLVFLFVLQEVDAHVSMISFSHAIVDLPFVLCSFCLKHEAHVFDPSCFGV